MTDDTALLEHVRDALRTGTRIGFDERPIALTLSNGDLVMEGELADVSAKRRALRKVAESIRGRFIVDRLHVRPAVAMEDGRFATSSAMPSSASPPCPDVGFACG